MTATFNALLKRAKRHAAYRRNLAQLNALNDATLRDLGLERSALDVLARKAAFEK
ncbi:DUF1127 domain-containing protein [Halovulum dunhuangense]|uniref:DUF1127 domain-containing protein n=1 Tax=Halovulum dunhuangense TaxID=1505036 RepID=A0A849L5H4_9RHOB|nr:DUF1127 domain-containing protein [Halovulum dunhuangense]NNU81432.1 DUF1127 domain-containing protein [Halovulum dunhuangense]